MTETLLDLLWYFFIYSFIGWCLEVVFTVCRRKKLVNKGFLNSPLCPIYGYSGVLIAVIFGELTDQLFFLFLGSLVLATFTEFVTGHLLQAIFHQKWWDYSERKWNLDGYVCAEFSLFWGLFGMSVVLFLNPLIREVTGLIPELISWIIVLTLVGLTAIDLIGTVIVLLQLRKKAGRIEAINTNLQNVSSHLRLGITRQVERRMQRAYPQVDTKVKVEKKKPQVFAEGNSFYKLVALFFIGSALGDLVETIFMYITRGHIVSRSSVVYGHFSIVWGLAVVILTSCLYRYRKRNLLTIFLIGTALGGTYEYACSVFTELVFGTIFWDYSKIPFNLGGRINLLYCFLWGAVAILWLKVVYPALSWLIEKIPIRLGRIVCNLLIVFMIINCLISGAALLRYRARNAGEPAKNAVEAFLDERFDDERMDKIYPYAKIVR
ncbi:MAG: putative ABC transporter permease [Lachnospiraceae bacterium]|nr:putative ABC transporter permease [Lachnospiraceae bacterium]